ncbi:virion structural protein [Pseudomonas phage PhiPA3]|uniref:Virion structural protein n=1 Tax=Pseudomonas phage PhiPA3 TaxID=998086 RepID=F8SJW6_BPPA3|nr:virion structural protein [Pseudomonas phage PhiPA3]AEH03511.1 virion structural protein [Pseudomonas phage PhiPA3]
MRLGYEISRHIKELKSPTNNERQLRAMMLANAIAFYVPFDPSLSVEQLIDTHLPTLRKVVGQVNENITVDSKLAQELFKQAIRIRFALLHGAADPAVILMAMKSETADSFQTPDETAAAALLTSRLDFVRAQNGIAEALRNLETDAQ